MGLMLEEQETTINIMRTGDRAEIYTSDGTMMTKLDKLVAQSDEWSLTEECRAKGEVIGKKYSCPKNLVSFRSKSVKRDLTEQQRQELADRLADMRQLRA